MKFSLVNGKRELPYKNATGICPCCKAPTRAFCGDIYEHHWKHINSDDCDLWYEPITKWHLDWQNCFPIQWQEQVIEKKGQIHRADILTDKQVILEFQNSPLSLSEALQREHFYEKLIWIINGSAFKDNFHIVHQKPENWESLFDEHDLYPKLKSYFVRPQYTSEKNPKVSRAIGLYNRHFAEHKTFADYYIFYWTRPRSVWLKCNMPIFFDFGDDYLWWLRKKFTLKRFTKNEFISKYRSINYHTQKTLF